MTLFQISLSVFIKTWGVKHWISFLDSVQSNLKKDLEQRIITGHDMQSTFGLNKLLSKSIYTCEVFKRNLKFFFQIIVSLFYQAADQGAHRWFFLDYAECDHPKKMLKLFSGFLWHPLPQCWHSFFLSQNCQHILYLDDPMKR